MRELSVNAFSGEEAVDRLVESAMKTLSRPLTICPGITRSARDGSWGQRDAGPQPQGTMVYPTGGSAGDYQQMGMASQVHGNEAPGPGHIVEASPWKHPAEQRSRCGCCGKLCCGLLLLVLLIPCVLYAHLLGAPRVVPEGTLETWGQQLHGPVQSFGNWCAGLVHHIFGGGGSGSPGSTEGEANCDGDSQTWVLEKRSRCCRLVGRGCADDGQYECHEGVSNWQKEWSQTKQFFCCGFDLAGCQKAVGGTSTTLESNFNCEIDLENWVTKWSPQKKAFCCQKYDFGCELTTTSVPYDCEADLLHFKTGWPVAKKEWCCTHEHVACEQASTAQSTTAVLTSVSTTVNVHTRATTGAPASSTAPAVAASSSSASTTKIASATGCDATCDVDGVGASCRDRINWIVNEGPPKGLAGQPIACRSALAVVIKDCGQCSSCPLAETECSGEGPHEEYVIGTRSDCPGDYTRVTSLQKCQAAAQALKAADQMDKSHVGEESNPSYPSGCYTWGGSTYFNAASEDSEQPETDVICIQDVYECKESEQDSISSWSAGKSSWCCIMQGIACPAGVSIGNFECVTEQANWGQLKKDWCCENAQIGCS